ncbi:aminotransferase class I/II-fold pyridoxal phosphate-dependent enzyme [Raineya orbicola]|jgi:8-amino-7-oxononanoate synthase|uniref:7-keto-8-aminopelargonate synthetase n=1 Tax=Raineya orbicola TaxID=2016530 RepID=A0A2N3IBK7_9BACT|nr:pyridoxal phosphate-dependent aminotransferase family protein [Raineya orbicola]PKQ67655.1 7-keto-8-aminopelargonate synthetase [Raineya orbicola]
MNQLLETLHEKLQKRKQEGNFRALKPQSSLVDFSSNDYLGLARNEILQINIEKELQKLPQPHLGATGSRLLSGTHPYVLELETFLAKIFQAEACLIFNSGYQLNTAILATIPQKNDVILCDELIHASLREGKNLSLAQSYYFRHSDLEDLEKKLQKFQEKPHSHIFVVVESVYSMDGDIAPLPEIINLCKQYGAYLIVDEAHSTGIYGKQGEGYCISQNLHQDIFARIYTFGKAIGGHGACITGSKILIEYLINFARAFIYTTALPLHSYIHIRKAFEHIAENIYLQENLYQKITLFKTALQNLSHIQLKESFTPIQILKIGGNERTKLFAQKLQEKGFDVRPVLSPTVKAGEEIIRICLHAFNTEQEIAELCRNILILAKEI